MGADGPGDSFSEAAELLSPDKRFLMQSWDARRAIGEAFSKTLQLKCPAWDVYLLYQPGVRWTGAVPPMPSFWMHQLQPKRGADQKLHLKPKELESEVGRSLKTAAVTH